MASLGDVIFRRNSTRSTSNSDASAASGDDLWDDRVLIDVYDKAISVAKEQVAKRLAMGTNSTDSPKGNLPGASKGGKKKSKNVAKIEWKNGSKCRAVYSQDGLEYEATIVDINHDDNMCTVSFIGYLNEEDVEMSALKPSYGERARMKQHAEAEMGQDNLMDLTSDALPDFNENTDFKQAESLKKTRKKNHHKSYSTSESNGFHIPMPNSIAFGSFPFNVNLESDMPLPLPPPPVFPPMSGSNSQEDQALSTMLISWYMSGYYTGLYQGQKMAKRTNSK